MRPTAVLEVSYEDPGDPPVWEDESDYLRAFRISRGRSTELDKTEAGTCTLRLDNRVGRFDPVNTAGAHYPKVAPMRRVRLRTSLDDGVDPFTVEMSYVGGSDVIGAGETVIPLWSGFVESWSQTWETTNGDAAVTVQCVDAFKIFNLAEFIWGVRYSTFGGVDTIQCGLDGVGVVGTFTPVIPDDLSSVRLTRILDCIGWPTDDRVVDVGTVTLLGSDPNTGTNIPVTGSALSHMQEIADTEGGLLFMDAQGMVRFIDAVHLPSEPTSPAEIYGGQTDEIGYLDIDAPYDDSRLWNDITVTTNASSLIIDATAEDATSIASYYRRPFTVSVLATGTSTLQARADAYLARYKDPHLRIAALTLSPMHSDDWRRILQHELGDYVRVKKRPATADVIDQNVRIEGITIETGTFENDNWVVNLKLSS